LDVEFVTDVKEFYETDDNSHMSPGKKKPLTT